MKVLPGGTLGRGKGVGEGKAGKSTYVTCPEPAHLNAPGVPEPAGESPTGSRQTAGPLLTHPTTPPPWGSGHAPFCPSPSGNVYRISGL